jgi:hypothetical protein
MARNFGGCLRLFKNVEQNLNVRQREIHVLLKAKTESLLSLDVQFKSIFIDGLLVV